MGKTKGKLFEFSRVSKETSTFKLFRRALGFGSASRVVERSFQSDDASVESMALALLHKERISRLRSEIRAAPVRLLSAAVLGTLDAVAYAVGKKTFQSTITDRLRAKSYIRMDGSALKATYPHSSTVPLVEVIARVNRLGLDRLQKGGLSKQEVLRNDLHQKFLSSDVDPDKIVGPGDLSTRHRIAMGELLGQYQAMEGWGDFKALTEATRDHLRENGLNPNAGPLENRKGLIQRRREGYDKPLSPTLTPDAYPRVQAGAMYQPLTDANPTVLLSARQSLTPHEQHFMPEHSSMSQPGYRGIPPTAAVVEQPRGWQYVPVPYSSGATQLPYVAPNQPSGLQMERPVSPLRHQVAEQQAASEYLDPASLSGQWAARPDAGALPIHDNRQHERVRSPRGR
jgi:hypothetical protein